MKMKLNKNMLMTLVLVGFCMQAVACTLYGVGATTCDCGTFTCSVPDGDVNGDVTCGEFYNTMITPNACKPQDGSCCASDFQETMPGTTK